MTMPSSPRRSGVTWAAIGGAVLLIGIVAVVVSGLLGQTPAPESPTALTPSTNPETRTPQPTEADSAIVDPSATDTGWVAEPITTDRTEYAAAALEAAATFDTQASSRDEWLRHLQTWFTSDTRYSESDRAAELDAAQRELRQSVVMPAEEWDSLARERGRVSGEVVGDIDFTSVSDDSTGDMSIATADVVLTFTRAGGGEELSYEETVTVSVQVLCGAGSVPSPGTAQQAGDCKVVRYFAEPVGG